MDEKVTRKQGDVMPSKQFTNRKSENDLILFASAMNYTWTKLGKNVIAVVDQLGNTVAFALESEKVVGAAWSNEGDPTAILNAYEHMGD